MQAIFIRGVPGTGKTVVAKEIKKRLSNSELITVDDFKNKKAKDDESFEESLRHAYEKALSKLYLAHKKNKAYIILDDIICEREFLKELIKFLKETKTPAYWFRLMRPIEELLKIESKRKRCIKNNKEQLHELKQKIDSLKIKNEYLIKNDDLKITIKKILEIVS